MAKRKVSQKLRKLVRERAQNHCEYCGYPASFANQFYAVEHILPLSLGGTHEEDNLAYACQCCNGHKYNKTQAPDPLSDEEVDLFNPREHPWHMHFCWSDDFLKIEGLSAIGRATIEALDLNRENLLRLRTVLYAFGAHPPKHLQLSDF